MRSLRKDPVRFIFGTRGLRYVSFYLFLPLINLNFLDECLSCRIQKPASKFFFPCFFFCCLIRKKSFYRHQVLLYAIKELQKAGYKLVTVAECLGQQPYHSQGPPSTRDVCVYFIFLPAYFLTFFGRCFVIY